MQILYLCPSILQYLWKTTENITDVQLTDLRLRKLIFFSVCSAYVERRHFRIACVSATQTVINNKNPQTKESFLRFYLKQKQLPSLAPLLHPHLNIKQEAIKPMSKPKPCPSASAISGVLESCSASCLQCSGQSMVKPEDGVHGSLSVLRGKRWFQSWGTCRWRQHCCPLFSSGNICSHNVP